MDLHEWLIKHTWVHWYIRDGHGNLRTLWDREKSIEGGTSEKRWTGYRGRPEVVEGTVEEVIIERRSRSPRRKRRSSSSDERHEIE